MNYNKVVYLLGAGASADNCLPTDIGFVAALRKANSDLAGYYHHLGEVQKSFINTIREDFNWLSQESSKFISVDSFAKYCFDHIKLPEFSSNFIRLKKTLSYYFLIEQVLYKRTDNRYRHFITKLTQVDSEGNHHFPSNVSILTWNYDFQMELASNIYRKEFFKSNEEYVLPFINYWPQKGNHSSVRGDINLIHLNGIAGFTIDSRNNNFINHNYSDVEIQAAQIFIQKLMDVGAHEQEMLTFAFEKKDEDYTELVKLIESVITNADYLVIIGYSFSSIENSLLDRKIFDVLKQGNLKKIYVQDFENKSEIIRDKFQFGANFPIEHRIDCKIFFMPHHIFETKSDSFVGPIW